MSKMREIRPEMQLVVPGEYCHKCGEFKPEVQESDIWANDRIVATARNIVCKNEALCRHLIDYLKQNGTDEGSSELHPRDPRHPDFLSVYLGEPFESKIMTNQEAADILKDIVNNMMYPIGSGKTGMMLRRYEAYAKAIKLLEKTPD